MSLQPQAWAVRRLASLVERSAHRVGRPPLPVVGVGALLLLLLIGSAPGGLVTFDGEAAYAHQEQGHIDLAPPDMHWTGPAGATGNGPGEPGDMAPVITGVVNKDADLRTGPGTVYAMITRLPEGSGVRLQLQYDKWYKVAAVDGTEGWLGYDEITFIQGEAKDVPIASYIPPAPDQPPLEEPVTDAPVNEEPAVEPVADVPSAKPTPEKESSVEIPPTTPSVTEPVPGRPAMSAPAQPVAAKPGTSAPAAKARWVWPTQGTITSGFGLRNLGVREFHNGIDIANDKGTPIVAAHAGTIDEAGWCIGYGYCVKIRHVGGLVSEYGHLVAKPPVRAGQRVQTGELVGHMGTTYDRSGGGYSTGVHLHFTLRSNGRAVNPRTYLP